MPETLPPGMQPPGMIPPGMPPQRPPMGAPPGMPPGMPPGGGGMLAQMGGPAAQIAQAAAGQVAGGNTEGLADLVAQLAKHLVGMVVNVPQAAQFQAGKELMETFRKWQKAEQTEPTMAPKM